MSAAGDLWRNAAPWRWLMSAALIATVLIVYLETTPTYHPATKAQTASYDPAAQRAAAGSPDTASNPPPQLPASAPLHADAPAAAPTPAPVASPSPASVATPPRSADAAAARAAALPPAAPAYGGPQAGAGAYGSGAAPAPAAAQPGSSNTLINPVAPDTSIQGPRTGIMGKTFVDTITLGGLRVPLPEGTWTVVAFMRGGGTRRETEIAVLANLKGQALAGLVAVSAYVDPNKTGAGFPPSNACNRGDYVVRETRVNEPQGAQECWWVNHAAQAWTQSAMRAARADLEMRGVSDFPDTLVNVGVWIADANRYVNMLLYFDPRSEAIATTPSSWEASEWHRSRIASYPDKERYVKKLESFGRSWIQIVRANL